MSEDKIFDNDQPSPKSSLSLSYQPVTVNLEITSTLADIGQPDLALQYGPEMLLWHDKIQSSLNLLLTSCFAKWNLPVSIPLANQIYSLIIRSMQSLILGNGKLSGFCCTVYLPEVCTKSPGSILLRY